MSRNQITLKDRAVFFGAGFFSVLAVETLILMITSQVKKEQIYVHNHLGNSTISNATRSNSSVYTLNLTPAPTNASGNFSLDNSTLGMPNELGDVLAKSFVYEAGLFMVLLVAGVVLSTSNCFPCCKKSEDFYGEMRPDFKVTDESQSSSQSLTTYGTDTIFVEGNNAHNKLPTALKAAYLLGGGLFGVCLMVGLLYVANGYVEENFLYKGDVAEAVLWRLGIAMMSIFGAWGVGIGIMETVHSRAMNGLINQWRSSRDVSQSDSTQRINRTIQHVTF